MKIETHAHCSEASPCGTLPFRKTLDAYKEKGYDLLVMTDHLSEYNANEKQSRGIEDYWAYYDNIYREAKAYGASIGIAVLKAYELRIKETGDNDYLVYGMSDEVAKNYRDLFNMRMKEIAALAQEKGFLVFQAHPFRIHMKIVKPSYLFGVEAFNGHPGHDSSNGIARMWAEKNGLRMLSGSDCHESAAVGRGGIVTTRRVETMDDFVSMLKDNDYSLLVK